MSLYALAPAAAGAAAGAAVGAEAAGVWPQPASMASARNTTMIVGVTLEAVMVCSFLAVIVRSPSSPLVDLKRLIRSWRLQSLGTAKYRRASSRTPIGRMDRGRRAA